MPVERPTKRLNKFLALPLSIVVLMTASFVGLTRQAFAREHKISISRQYGLAFLPLIVMRDRHLVAKEAAKEGIDDVKVTWPIFGGGAAANEALLSGSVDFASGGAGPLIKLWSATRGNLDVKGVASISAMPFRLTTIDPAVKTIADFTKKDRIALPAVKVSMQAITLEMAAAKTFGEKHYDKLDNWTVSMKNPDATAQLLSSHPTITAHFSGPPWPSIELKNPKIHVVLTNYQVLGGPGMLVGLYTTSRFRKNNPRLFRAVLAALKNADQIINSNKREAAKIYVRQTHSKLSVDFVYKVISDPRNQFSVVPRNTMKYAHFMYKTGAIKHDPNSWKDLFFPEIHGVNGS